MSEYLHQLVPYNPGSNSKGYLSVGATPHLKLWSWESQEGAKNYK